jgi:hypothetical protein
MSTTKDPELAKNDLEVTSSVSSSKHAGAAAPIPREGETVHLPNFEHEKALCWKFDLRMLPMLALMYLFNVRLLDSCNSARSNRMTGT